MLLLALQGVTEYSLGHKESQKSLKTKQYNYQQERMFRRTNKITFILISVITDLTDYLIRNIITSHRFITRLPYLFEAYPLKIHIFSIYQTRELITRRYLSPSSFLLQPNKNLNTRRIKLISEWHQRN